MTRTRRPFRVGRLLAFMAFAVIAWIATIGITGAMAWAELRRGLRTLDRGKASLGIEDLASAKPARVLDAAASHFDRAHSLLDVPVFVPVRVLPVAGRHYLAVRALAGAAAEASRTGADTADGLRAGLAAVNRQGPARVAAAHDARTMFDRADRRLARLDLGPGHALIGSVADTRARFAARIAEARRAMRASSAAGTTIESMLRGSDYLLVAANNAEMRAGTGMFLSIAPVHFEDGAIELGAVRPANQLTLPGDGVPVAGDLADRWGFLRPGREWRNLAPSPRFAPSAEVAARMWTSLTGQQVDGVLAIDVPAVAGLLAATGPVTAGDVSVTPANAADFLLHDQYASVAADGTARRDSQAQRRELLGDLAAGIVASIENGDVDVQELAGALRTAVRGRHLMAWAKQQGAQQGWEAIGVDGRLRHNSLALSLLNRGGNKLDPFMRIEATLADKVDAGMRHVTVQARIRNETPNGEPPYIAGPGEGIDEAPGTYIGILALNVPAQATNINASGRDLVAAGADGPTRVVATDVVVARRGEEDVTFAFDLPVSVGPVRIEPSARVPATRWTAGGRTVSDRKPRTVEW